MSRSNCRKHLRHRQSPGICSICLNEKLSQLISTPTINNSSSSSQAAKSLSSSSSYLSSLSSSSDPSSCSSPAMNIGYSRKMDRSKARKSIRVFKNQNHVLNKSRSMAFVVPRRRIDEDEDRKKIGVGIKRGFWSKLLPRASKGLMHSKTMRERVTDQFMS